MKKLTLPLALLLSFPLALAQTRNTVQGDLQSFVYGIQALIRGDTAGFAAGITNGMTLVGLFVVVFGLMFFITKFTIFKAEEHSKYARMVAIGIALLGVFQQTLYDAILGWSTTFLIITFITAVIFMFIIFLNKSRTKHVDVMKDLHISTKNAIDAERILRKEQHEFEHEKKLYRRIEHDLADLNSELHNIAHLAGSEKKKLNEIGGLLRKAQIAKGHSLISSEQYAHALTNNLAALIKDISNESNESSKLLNLANRIESVLEHWKFSDAKEAEFEHTYSHYLKELLIHLGKNDDALFLKMFGSREDIIHKDLISYRNILHTNFSNLHKMLSQLNSLNKQFFIDVESDLTNFKSDTKLGLVKSLRTAVFDYDFKEANDRLDELLKIVNQQDAFVQDTAVKRNQMEQLVNSVHHLKIKIVNDIEKIIPILHKLEKNSK